MRAPKSAQTLPGLGTGLPDGWSLPKGAGALPLAISGQQKTGFCSSCGGCGQHPPPQSSQGAGASGCHAWNHSQRGLSSRSPRTRAPEEHRSLSSLQWASCHLFDDPGRAARWEGHGVCSQLALGSAWSPKESWFKSWLRPSQRCNLGQPETPPHPTSGVGHAQSQPTPTSSLQPWGPRPHLVAQTDDVPLPGRSPTHCTGDITSRSEAATSSQRRPTSPGRAGALSMTGPPVQTLHGR
ncbi:uncharacterized protein LOC116663303 isoform X1 [Camelus ferus]|uniref:Uncharacterized protein LOC116663303 isoform X1 n=1 Tax=Camelus ferus TaxID=419612 RepID=A0A8B8SX92_CAMFR|nr:uncharacterized protein LOC116663303 isoform X1 [Camelus ferus]